MKTAFKTYRGHVYHVVHETKSGAARKSAWTLCGQYFDSGERSTHRPSCPDCKKLDNPLGLTPDDLQFLKTVVDLGKWRDAPKSKSFERLLERDLLDRNFALTRRGQVLAEDWTQGAVPFSDENNIVHARAPLSPVPVCRYAGPLRDVHTMSTSTYQKLRKLEETIVVTCLACLGK